MRPVRAIVFVSFLLVGDLLVGCSSDDPFAPILPAPESTLRSVEPLLQLADMATPVRNLQLGLDGQPIRLAVGDRIELTMTLDGGHSSSWVAELTQATESLDDVLARLEPRRLGAAGWMPPVSVANGRATIDSRDTDIPVVPTQTVWVEGVLDSDSDAAGTSLIQTGGLLADALGSDDLSGLRSGSDGTALGLSNGNVIAVLGSIGGSSISSIQFVVGETVDGADGTTLEKLRAWFQAELMNEGAAGVTVTLNADGSMTVNNASGALLEDIQLQVGGRPAFNQAMLFGQQIPSGETASSTALLSPAENSDVLDTVFNGSADRLDFRFVGGHTDINISGTRGGEAITPGGLAVVQGVTTLDDLFSVMESSFQVSNQVGIQLDASGRITVQGDEGLPSGIGNISITEAGNINSNITGSIDFSVLSPARDATEFAAASLVVDPVGRTFPLQFSFEKRTGENVWDWFASVDEGTITTGAAGIASFNSDGSLASFLMTDGGVSITIATDSGISEIQILAENLQQVDGLGEIYLNPDGVPLPVRIEQFELAADRADGERIALIQTSGIGIGELWVGSTVWWAPAISQTSLASLRMPRTWPTGLEVLDDEFTLTMSVEREGFVGPARSIVQPADASLDDFVSALASALGETSTATVLENGSVQVESPGVTALWLWEPGDEENIMEFRMLPPVQ